MSDPVAVARTDAGGLRRFGLSRRQRRVLRAIASGPSRRDGCLAAGISEICFANWIAQPAFRKALERLEDRRFGDALEMLRRTIEDGIATLRRLLEAKEDGIVLQAARELCQLAARINDANIARRLEAIEDEQSAKKGDSDVQARTA